MNAERLSIALCHVAQADLNAEHELIQNLYNVDTLLFSHHLGSEGWSHKYLYRNWCGVVLIFDYKSTLDQLLRAAGYLRTRGVPVFVLASYGEIQDTYRHMVAVKVGAPVVNIHDKNRLAGHIARPFLRQASPTHGTNSLTTTATSNHLLNSKIKRSDEQTFHRAHLIEVSNTERHIQPRSLPTEGRIFQIQGEGVNNLLVTEKPRIHDVILIKFRDVSSNQLQTWLSKLNLAPSRIDPCGDTLLLTPTPTTLSDPPIYRSPEVELWFDVADNLLCEEGFMVEDMLVTESGQIVVSYIPIRWPQSASPPVICQTLVLATGSTGLGDIVWITASLSALAHKHGVGKMVIAAPGSQAELLASHPIVAKCFPIRCCPDWRSEVGLCGSLLHNFLGVHITLQYAEMTWLSSAGLLRAPLKHMPRASLYAAFLGLNIPNPKVEVVMTPKDHLRASEYMRYKNMKDGFKVGIQFNASTVSRSWPQENAASFLKRLNYVIPGVQIIDFDEAYSDDALRVRELAATIAMCDMFVGVDSLGGHLAASAKRPTVTIYGYGRPRYLNGCAPLGKNIGIEPQFDCYCLGHQENCVKCISSLSHESVIQALLWMICSEQSEGRWLQLTPLEYLLWEEDIVCDLNLSAESASWGRVPSGVFKLEVMVIAELLHKIGHAYLQIHNEYNELILKHGLHLGINIVMININKESDMFLSMTSARVFDGQIRVTRVQSGGWYL